MTLKESVEGFMREYQAGVDNISKQEKKIGKADIEFKPDRPFVLGPVESKGLSAEDSWRLMGEVAVLRSEVETWKEVYKKLIKENKELREKVKNE